MNFVPVPLRHDRHIELTPRTVLESVLAPSTLTSGPTSSPPSWLRVQRWKIARMPLAADCSLGRCLIGETWPSSTAALRPSTRSHASRRAGSSHRARGRVHRPRHRADPRQALDRRQQVLADVGAVEALHLTRRPAPPRSERRAARTSTAPAGRDGRVPSVARPVRGGRRDPGAPRSAGHPLRRCRRARLRHLHGQGHRQVGAARQRPPGRGMAVGGTIVVVGRGDGRGDRSPRPPRLREAGQPRVVHRRGQGGRRGGARGTRC